MLKLFSQLASYVKIKLQTNCIDNWMFQLHYRATTLILFAATILVTATQYFGSPIQCINDMKDERFSKVIHTFCFTQSTFTVVQYNREGNHRLATGVGPLGIDSEGTIRRHTYYQWIPFVLFFQAVMFYIPHFLWKHCEGQSLKHLVTGVTFAKFSTLDKDITIGEKTVPSLKNRQKCLDKLRSTFIERLILNNWWSSWLICFEILNLLNIIFQFCITNEFLGKQFFTLGTNVMKDGWDTLEDIFPKLTKCTFRKYGGSGSIQVHDALCVMALNNIHEKIYTFMWFWFILLMVTSSMAILWRLACIVLYRRCRCFNELLFSSFKRSKISSWNISLVIKRLSFSDWLFLRYLSKNMDGLAFRELFLGLSEDLMEDKCY